MEFKFPSIDKYIKDDDIVISSNEKSSEYVNILKLIGEYGKAIDKAKCAVPFSNNFGCSVCIESCTFFNGDYEKIKTNFQKHK